MDNLKNSEKITQNDVIEILDKDTKTNITYDIKTNILYVVKKDSYYFDNGNNLNLISPSIHMESIIFSFKIIDIQENSITIITNPMYEINEDSPKGKFKLTKSNKLCLHTPILYGNTKFEFELTIKEKTNKNIQCIDIEDDYTNFSCGIFINLTDIEALKIYSYDYYNINMDRENTNIKHNIPIPEKIATNWILNQNNFKIISELLYVSER